MFGELLKYKIHSEYDTGIEGKRRVRKTGKYRQGVCRDVDLNTRLKNDTAVNLICSIIFFILHMFKFNKVFHFFL